MAGLDACLRLGADIIVNTDADNQYCADDIPILIAPILDGPGRHRRRRTADQRDRALLAGRRSCCSGSGSWAVRAASGTDIPDAPSGFRAMSREAAMRLNVFSEYTYTLETIIQAGQKGMAITSVPIRVNERPASVSAGQEQLVVRAPFDADHRKRLPDLPADGLLHRSRRRGVGLGTFVSAAVPLLLRGRAGQRTHPVAHPGRHALLSGFMLIVFGFSPSCSA